MWKWGAEGGAARGPRRGRCRGRGAPGSTSSRAWLRKPRSSCVAIARKEQSPALRPPHLRAGCASVPARRAGRRPSLPPGCLSALLPKFCSSLGALSETPSSHLPWYPAESGLPGSQTPGAPPSPGTHWVLCPARGCAGAKCSRGRFLGPGTQQLWWGMNIVDGAPVSTFPRGLVWPGSGLAEAKGSPLASFPGSHCS